MLGKLPDVLKWNSQLPIRSGKRGGCRGQTIQQEDECHLSAEQKKFTGAYECHEVVHKRLCTNNKTFCVTSFSSACCMCVNCTVLYVAVPGRNQTCTKFVVWFRKCSKHYNVGDILAI